MSSKLKWALCCLRLELVPEVVEEKIEQPTLETRGMLRLPVPQPTSQQVLPLMPPSLSIIRSTLATVSACPSRISFCTCPAQNKDLKACRSNRTGHTVHSADTSARWPRTWLHCHDGDAFVRFHRHCWSACKACLYVLQEECHTAS